MGEQCRLQLGRRHLESLEFDELLQPVDHVDVGVGVAEVAGVKPPVFVNRGGGRRRIVEVALHHLRPLDPQLAIPIEVKVGAGWIMVCSQGGDLRQLSGQTRAEYYAVGARAAPAL